MAAGRAALGFFSFTEVTDPSSHVAYNEWHQLDHLPEQMPLKGIVSGKRWARTPACRSRGRAEDRPGGLSATDYVTLYLMEEPLGVALEAFRDLAAELRRSGRFFEPRRALLSGPFRVDAMAAAPRVRVSPAAVPHRPDRGVVLMAEGGVVAGHPEDPTRGNGPVDILDDLVAIDGVAGAWVFSSDRRWDDLGWRPGDHRITVCFLDADPLEATADVGRLLEGAGRAAGRALRLLCPLVAITPWEWERLFP